MRIVPTESEFEATLDQLKEYVEDLDDLITHERAEGIVTYASERDGEEYAFTGHRCMHEDSTYLIAGHPKFRFVSILYYLSIRKFISSSISEELAESIVDQELEDENLFNEAYEVLLENTPAEEIEAVSTYLYMMVSSGDQDTSVGINDGDPLDIVAISSHTFPYEQSFGISDFYDTKRSVLSAGERMNELISKTIYLNLDESNPEDSKLNFNYSL